MQKNLSCLKQSTISQIRQQEANPNAVAQNHYNGLIYGKDNIRSRNTSGTIESVTAITLDDLKAFYGKSISPSVARMHVVGALNKAAITGSFSITCQQLEGKPVAIPTYPTPQQHR